MFNNFLKCLKYFFSTFIAFFLFFSFTNAEEHYKKVEKKYVMDLVKDTITYSSKCNIECRNSNNCFSGEDLSERALICDSNLRRPEDISPESIERKSFVDRLVFTKTYELNSFIIGGEECTKPTTIGGNGTQGCTEFTITTKDAQGLIGKGTYDIYNYLIDQPWTTETNFNNNIIMFNYDEKLNVNEAQRMCETDGTRDHPCSNGTFSYYQQAFGDIYNYRLNKYSEQTLYARGTNVIDKINASAEEGSYVCVAIPIEHYFNLNDKEDNYEEQRNYNSYYANYSGYYIAANIGNNENEALDNCKKIFPQQIDKNNSSDLDLINDYYGSYTLFNIAVYKISKVQENIKEKLNIKQESAGLTCGWQMEASDKEKYNVSTKLFLTLSGNYGATGFSSGENLGELYPSVRLGVNDIEAMLNEETYFKNNFSKSVTSKEPTDTIGIVQVGIIAASVAAIAITTVVTFGAGTAAITAAAVGGFIISTIKTAILTTVTFVALEGVKGFIKDAQVFTGNVPTKAWIYYDNGKMSNKNNVDAKCDYSDFAPDDNIGGNEKIDCPTILNGDFGHILTYIMNILRFVGCALLILFGVMDFVKPIVSGDAEMLQKSGGKFIKRLIVFVLILFTPAIVKLLLSIIDRQSCDL